MPLFELCLFFQAVLLRVDERESRDLLVDVTVHGPKDIKDVELAPKALLAVEPKVAAGRKLQSFIPKIHAFLTVNQPTRRVDHFGPHMVKQVGLTILSMTHDDSIQIRALKQFLETYCLQCLEQRWLRLLLQVLANGWVPISYNL